MWKTHLILFFILASVLVNSCVEFSDEINSLDYKPGIVIDGLVVNLPNKSYVRINTSSPDGKSINEYPISNASVIISEDGYKIDTFKVTYPGLYANSSFLGKENAIYTMIVNYEGVEYKATSTLLPVTTIDSLVYKSVYSDSVRGNEYSLFAFANRTSAYYTSYYKVKFYQNDSLFNSYSDLLLFDDLYFESFKELEFPQTYWSGDNIKVEVYSLDEAVYNYYVELSGLTQGNLNTIYYYPLNPKTNISNGAFGVFQASSVSSTEIVLP